MKLGVISLGCDKATVDSEALIARFVYNAVPGRARGSTAAVDAWIAGQTPAGDA